MADKKASQHKHRHRHKSNLSEFEDQDIKIGRCYPGFTSQGILHHIKKRFAPMVDSDRYLNTEIRAKQDEG